MLEKSTTTTHPAAVLFCLISLLLMVVVIIGGCAPPKRDREIANSAATIHEAVAAIAALPSMPAPSAAPLAAAERQASAIADAVGYQLPAEASSDDPRPIATPAADSRQWIEVPSAAAESSAAQAEETAGEAPAQIPWGAIGASLAAVLALLARFHPASGALAVAVGGIRDLAWAMATPRHVREAEEDRDRKASKLDELQARIDKMANA